MFKSTSIFLLILIFSLGIQAQTANIDIEITIGIDELLGSVAAGVSNTISIFMLMVSQNSRFTKLLICAILI